MSNFQPLDIAVIGLGYVGLPLLIELSKHHRTTGFDIDKTKILELSNNIDTTGEISETELELLSNSKLTSDENNLLNSNIYIITVPTPVDINKKPDFSALINATRQISKYITTGDLVIYESTVHPGATREICIPILEQGGHELNKDFYVGYSPERVVPGIGNKRLTEITKLISISDNTKMHLMHRVYSDITKSNLHEVSSIEAAETAKIFENIQRDVNIGLINEFSNITHGLDIDISEVLQACSTKWNFLNFHPGLVGGHCIGVDPYYLIEKCSEKKIDCDIIKSARNVNENASSAYAQKLISRETCLKHKTILIIGYTFKENCKDCRNTKVFDLYKHLSRECAQVNVYDPLVSTTTLDEKVDFVEKIDRYDIYLIATWHDVFNYGDFTVIEQLKQHSNSSVYSLRKMINLEFAQPL